MALNALTRDPGVRNGRIQPHGATPPTGSLFSFVLGRDGAGLSVEFNIGDFVEAFQTADFTSAQIMRVVIAIRAPVVLPVGASWKFYIKVGALTVASQVFSASRSRTRIDMAANVSKLIGMQTVTFRLEVVAV